MNKLNELNSWGQTPIQRAIQDKQFDIARELCARGVDLMGWDRLGFTVLHYAVQVNNLDLFKILLEAGANIEATTLLGYTVGHTAAKHPDCLILRYLKSIGFNLNRVDNMTQASPIMTASLHGNFPAVRFLREHGYQTDGIDYHGSNLGGLALLSKNLELLKYLHQIGITFICGGFNVPPLDWAVRISDLNFCQSLIDQMNPRINPLIGYGCWCSSGTCHQYQPEVCPMLLSRILNSKASISVEVACLLLARGMGYGYIHNPS